MSLNSLANLGLGGSVAELCAASTGPWVEDASLATHEPKTVHS